MLRLRALNSGDCALLVQYLNNPQVTLYLSSRIPQPYTPEDAQWWINDGSRAEITRAIEWNGVCVGCIGIDRKLFEQSHTAEIGYWLAESFWNKGIATLALKEMCQYLFSTTDIVRLQAHVYDGNNASAKVLQKCGFSVEGKLQKAIFKNGVFSAASVMALIKQ